MRTDTQKQRYYRRRRAAALPVGGTTFFPLRDDGETVQQCQSRLRSLLATWRETYLFRWSVRQDESGVVVTKVGEWPGMEALTTWQARTVSSRR